MGGSLHRAQRTRSIVLVLGPLNAWYDPYVNAAELQATVKRSPLTFTELVGTAAIFGVGGWALENALSEEPRYSALFRGVKIPFLPVYAAGGAGVVALAPTMKAQGLPWFARGALYGGLLTGIEWAACQLDRHTFDARSWDYGADAPAEGCIDIKHAVAWGALGLLAEAFATPGTGSPRNR